MSIEKIERALRDNLDGVTLFTEADVMRYEHGGSRIAILRDGERKLVADTYHEADTEHFALCRPENIRALLDELSRLREVERRAKELANSFYVFTIEDDDGIRLSTGGMVVAHYSEHSPEGVALLKLDAAARALSEREGQEE